MKRVFGIAAWMLPLAVYAASLDGAIAYWDTGESQVVPWIFGIAHPTGFPAFTMLAGLFAHVFAVGTVAWRVALFSAIAMSIAAWAIYRTLRELGCGAWLALGTAYAFAFGDIVWTRGTRAEVHALSACFAALTIMCAVRWYARGEARSLRFGGLWFGLGIATHPVCGLLAPGLAALLGGRRKTVKMRDFGAACVLLIAALALYAYLPIRSAMVTQARLDPTLSLGDPPGKAFWDMNHPASWAGFKTFLSGSDYGAGGVLVALIRPETYVNGAPPFFAQLMHEFTPLLLLLAAAGVVALARRDAVLAGALLLCGAFPAFFAFGYTIEADLARYYLIPFIVTALFAGYGMEMLARALPSMRFAVVLAAFCVAAGLLALNRQTFHQRASVGAAPMIASVAAHTPDGAVLLAPWIDSTALAYAAYVDRSLGMRIVDSAWLADEKDRVPGWIARGRRVFVVGQLFGSVPHYTLKKIADSPDIFEVIRQ